MNAFIRFRCRVQGKQRVLLIGLSIFLTTCSLLHAQSIQELVQRADGEPDPVKAEAYYTEVLRINPNIGGALLGRSIVRGQRGLLQAALEDAAAAIALYDTVAVYYGQRAYLLIQLSEYDAASQDLQKAIQLSPRDARFYSSLSYCRLKQNRLVEAIRLAETGIRLNPTIPNAYRSRGRARLYQGRLAEAVADFERSLILKHAEPHRVLTDLGEVAERQKNYLKAYEYYQRALQLKQGFAEADVRSNRLIREGLIVGKKSTGNSAVQSTFVGKRVALVVGNADYPYMDLLGEQPIADAQAVANRLDSLGFTVLLGLNTTTDSLKLYLKTFYDMAHQADLALFYFAGHGAQYDGANYLLPVDIELHASQPEQYVEKLSKQALLVTTVIERLQKSLPRYCVIMLDACREDPLKGKRVKTAGQERHIPEPFVPIVVENFIRNCCIGQATTSGTKAWNGPNRNGCYTEALLRYLTLNANLDQMLKRVRSDVMETAKKANKDQRPESIDQTTDDLIF